MEKVPLGMVPPRGIQKVHRYYFSDDLQAKLDFDHRDYFDPDVLLETRRWVSENLTQDSTMVRLFSQWVVNTTNDDDLAILVLKYGISRRS